jgi:Polysaccharide lyase family 4, domain II
MMNGWLPVAMVLPVLGLLAWPVGSFGYEAISVTNGGTIVGEVTYDGTPPQPESFPVTKDEKVCGTAPKVSQALLVGPDKGIQGVVVFLPDIQKGKAQEQPAKHPMLDQQQCEYHPHIQIFPAGSTLDIINDDGVLHNVKTDPGSKTTFNIAQPKFRKKIEKSFDSPDIVRVECNVHGWMHAVLVVSGNPYYTLTDAHGAFKLANVPPGKYTLKLWHETLGEQTKDVTVNPNEEVKVALRFKGA